MRFVNPHKPFHIPNVSIWNKLIHKLLQRTNEDPFKKVLLEIFKKYKVVVLFALRQYLLRWGLSKYHGDCTGKPGHLQFKLANVRINKRT